MPSFKPSIKIQLALAYVVLIIPIFMLGYLTVSTYSSFTSTTQKTILQEEFFQRSAKLQREVIDLQRNVLIYKDTASESSARRIGTLYKSLTATIQLLRANIITTENENKISHIEKHLKDYKDNFDIVAKSRSGQKKLIEEYIEINSPALQEFIFEQDKSLEEKHFLSESIYNAHQSSLSYLITSDQIYIDIFTEWLTEAKNEFSEHEDIQSKINSYQKSFQKIVIIQRNYTYLINVVMAGSAKEILYYANELSNASKQKTIDINTYTINQINQQKNIIYLVLALSLILGISAPAYFFRLITRPIKKITEVFSRLSSNQPVSHIPGQERRDEIGMLAQAADVFRSKNRQTQSLLTQAQTSIELQKKLNEDLKEAKTSIEKSLSVKSDFLANMSHELRTPLNSVIGYTVRMLKNHETLNERQKKSLHAIERNGKHLLAMINDILDISKAEANKLEVRLNTVNVPNLCQEAISQIRSVSDAKGLPIIFENPSKKDFEVRTDSTRLLQIISNILSNAIKYTEAGTITTTVSTNSKMRAVTVSIQDTGIGIEAKNMGRLFNRFEQFDSETRFNVGHGTGLGLAIVDNVAKLLNIQINAESTFGQGSLFTLIIPFDPEADHEKSNITPGLLPIPLQIV